MLNISLHFCIFELPTNQALEGENRVRWIDDSLTFSRQANEALAMLREGYYGRCRAGTLGVLYHPSLLPFHDGNT